MEELLRQIEDMGLAKKLGILAFLILLSGYFGFQFLLKKPQEELVTVTEKSENLFLQITQQRRKVRNLKSLRAKVAELDEQLERVSQELPEADEIEELLASVSDLAKSAGLDVKEFKPQGEAIREFYAEKPVSLRVEGTYHEVAGFFDAVGKLDRIVNISNISLKLNALEDAEATLQADCVVTAFRYLQPSERQAIEGATKSNRRRR